MTAVGWVVVSGGVAAARCRARTHDGSQAERTRMAEPDGPGAGGDPDLQRAGQPRLAAGPAARRRARGRRPRRRRRAARTAPASSPTSWPPRTRRIRVLHRTAKAGLGAAYLAGFAGALQGELPGRRRDGRRRLARPRGPARAARRARRRRRRDRLAVRAGRSGGELADAPRSGSPAAATCTPGSRSASPIRDITGGYRAFRAAGARGARPSAEVASQGYCFQVDMAWRAVQAGFRVREVPITFTERERGDVEDERRRSSPRRCGGSPGGESPGCCSRSRRGR